VPRGARDDVFPTAGIQRASQEPPGEEESATMRL